MDTPNERPDLLDMLLKKQLHRVEAVIDGRLSDQYVQDRLAQLKQAASVCPDPDVLTGDELIDAAAADAWDDAAWEEEASRIVAAARRQEQKIGADAQSQASQTLDAPQHLDAAVVLDAASDAAWLTAAAVAQAAQQEAAYAREQAWAASWEAEAARRDAEQARLDAETIRAAARQVAEEYVDTALAQAAAKVADARAEAQRMLDAARAEAAAMTARARREASEMLAVARHDADLIAVSSTGVVDERQSVSAAPTLAHRRSETFIDTSAIADVFTEAEEHSWLLDRLLAQPVLVLVGSPGVGKTSLLRCAQIPEELDHTSSESGFYRRLLAIATAFDSTSSVDRSLLVGHLFSTLAGRNAAASSTRPSQRDMTRSLNLLRERVRRGYRDVVDIDVARILAGLDLDRTLPTSPRRQCQISSVVQEGYVDRLLETAWAEYERSLVTDRGWASLTTFLQAVLQLARGGRTRGRPRRRPALPATEARRDGMRRPPPTVLPGWTEQADPRRGGHRPSGGRHHHRRGPGGCGRGRPRASVVLRRRGGVH
jgi:hypothetical protein